ncbi:hypothetical protein PAE9249_02477 [Paenibacillus sp. CECT 9249]|uniref:DUF4832 domain-containing protein n=1 Tax=Paenibacillus sp. CECT 9249 TaxID=2845385 RepID=UPI001E52B04C|nr:DUF4832 domain-containing protein [Paenibacillus sp. CECT 9249]CAH0119968.1 hypothetical protein PAE9249_02477 [Paenibacillus sp. CECT 9249]
MCKCQYSLERYEKYKTVKIRPRPLPRTPDNSGNGKLEYISFAWKDLEASRGEYTLEQIGKSLDNARNPILILSPEPPSWVKDRAEDYFASFVRKIGSYIGTDGRLAGVVISTLADSKEEWNAYMDSFETVPVLADLHHGRLIRYLQEQNREFGLLVRCGENNWIDCCEAFARQNLQHIWKTQPVVLHITDQHCGPHIRREAQRWHACLSNQDIGLGYDLQLRRLTFPETVSSGGSLPLRFWFVNAGSSRIYKEFDLSLLLKQGDLSYEIPIHAASHSWLTGDLVHNEIVPLPDMQPGTYTVSLGLFFKDRSYIRLAIQGEEAGGYYELGTVQVETTGEDPFSNIWDTYYPEGYYPLEDPQVPEQD